MTRCSGDRSNIDWLLLGRSLIFLITAIALAVTAVQAQSEILSSVREDGARWSWAISASNAYSQNGSSRQWYPNTDIDISIRRGGLNIGSTIFLNQQQEFLFQPGRLIIRVEDEEHQFSEDTDFDSRPDFYQMSQPGKVYAQFANRRMQVTGALNLLSQRSDFETPEIATSVDTSLFVINWNPLSKRNSYVLGSLIAGYSMRSVVLQAGLLSVPVIRFGDAGFRDHYRPAAQLFLGATWRLNNWEMAGLSDSKNWSVHMKRTFDSRFLSSRPLQASLGFQSGLTGFNYQGLMLKFYMPFNKFDLTLGYDVTRLGESWGNRTDFRQWQRSNSYSGFFPLDRNLPHQAIYAKVRVRLDREKPGWPLRVINQRLLQQHIFSAKHDFYAHNPIAMIDIFNEKPHTVTLQLLAETSDHTASFRSEQITIRPRQVQTVPVYLFVMANETLPDDGVSEQLILKAIINGRHQELSVMPITIYGRRAWDGQTASLRYFVTPGDSYIKNRAKQAYLTSLRKLSDSPGPRRDYEQLRNFIEHFGKALHYIPDPTTTLSVDQVQYPAETYSRGGGDCEDITVSLGSALMSVGYNTVVVDVRPATRGRVSIPTAKKSSIGHVFMLVDTGIEAEHMSEIGLNEFQAVIRQNQFGVDTIWIAIETTEVSNGFQAAFDEGVRQYYTEVIEKQGVTNGNVHVYELN